MGVQINLRGQGDYARTLESVSKQSANREDGSALGLTVRYRSPDDDALFGSAEVLHPVSSIRGNA